MQNYPAGKDLNISTIAITISGPDCEINSADPDQQANFGLCS